MSSGALYEGLVHHRRSADVEHEFSYRVALAYVDVDDLAGALAFGPFASARGPALLRLRRQDLLGDPRVPLGDAVRDHVADRTGRRPTGPIRVLTALRCLGVGFNPVRFYYCFAGGGEELDAVVAEVTNTPWGERHAYVLTRGADGRWAGTMAKELHVSPFLPMDQEYHWRVSAPGRDLVVHLESRALGVPGPAAFDATLTLERRPLTRRTLASMLVRYPPQPLRIVAGIYGQALRLRRKGAPYHPHPAA
jgi:DUF1365 family protein